MNTFHLQLAEYYWKSLLEIGDCVIDATCGNGQDTLKLAKLVLEKDKGRVIGIDIQNTAIERTSHLLKESLTEELLKRISLYQRSHEDLSLFKDLPELKLVVYNLGYLPRGDKTITTLTQTTLQSISQALDMIVIGGAISIMCYPGHNEGFEEHQAILNTSKQLDPLFWDVSSYQKINRANSPSLLLLKKRKQTTLHSLF